MEAKSVKSEVSVEAETSERYNGTDHQNLVGMREFVHWLPHTWNHLSECVPKVSSFEELVKLLKAQSGHVFSIMIKIISAGTYIMRVELNVKKS